MAKSSKSTLKKTTSEKPVKIKGDFLEVFKVVKKNKEENLNYRNMDNNTPIAKAADPSKGIVIMRKVEDNNTYINVMTVWSDGTITENNTIPQPTPKEREKAEQVRQTFDETYSSLSQA